jgi:hypothetical protein
MKLQDEERKAEIVRWKTGRKKPRTWKTDDKVEERFQDRRQNTTRRQVSI